MSLYRKGGAVEEKRPSLWCPKWSLPRQSVKMKSTRLISRNLKSKGFSISHVTVHTYLRKNLKVRPYKPQVQPKFTEKQRTARLKFCNERKNWTIETGRGFNSRMSPPSSYFKLQISKTTEFGQNLVSMSPRLKR